MKHEDLVIEFPSDTTEKNRTHHAAVLLATLLSHKLIKFDNNKFVAIAAGEMKNVESDHFLYFGKYNEYQTLLYTVAVFDNKETAETFKSENSEKDMAVKSVSWIKNDIIKLLLQDTKYAI